MQQIRQNLMQILYNTKRLHKANVHKEFEMLTGKLISIDTATNQGKIEQDLNKRVFDFDLKVWQDDNGAPKVGEDVEFEVEMRVVTRARIKPKPVDPDTIPMTKMPNVCIEEFFDQENKILREYSDFVEGHSSLDFLRMRRFLLTAYNDLCEMDNLIENEDLRDVKHEINSLFRDFENYVKKAQYTPAYAFEKIFLSKQVEFIKVEKEIESTQAALANAKAQCQTMGNNLEAEERRLQRFSNKNSQEYTMLEKEVKAIRRAYVDLIQFIATRQEFLEKAHIRLKKFKDEHFSEFVSVYTPMLRDIRDRFISLLNSKAFDLDSALWGRAKLSESVRRFFRDARIEGGFNSKTFLRYFLRGIDRTKASPKSKELFDLLKYLEDASKKSVLVLRNSQVDGLKYKEVIQKIDSTLNIIVEKNAMSALKTLVTNPCDIVVIEEKIGEMSALDFIQNSKQLPNQKNIVVFCLVVDSMPKFEQVEEAKEAGVQYFIPKQNMDALFDSVRMAI